MCGRMDFDFSDVRPGLTTSMRLFFANLIANRLCKTRAKNG
jgi:hypothetical protein